MSFKTGDKVRLTTGTLFVAKGGEGVIVDPVKGQTPPQLFPWRVQFPIGQDTRTVWCGTDEIELIDDAGPTTDDSVADGSRDYCPEGGPEDGNPADTTQAGPPEVCPCVTGGLCEVFVDDCTDECREPCKGPDYYYPLVEQYGDEQEGPWADDWEWEHDLDEFAQAVSTVFLNAEALLLQKHADYGPKNISQSPGGPLNGLRVRMHDKLARLNHLVDKGQEPQVLDEKLTDTLLDLANYAIIGVLVLKGEWPSE